MQIYQSYWVSLPGNVRDALRKQFNVGRSKGTVVEGGKVVCDGSDDANLSVVNTESLQEFLGVKDTDFEKLLRMAIDKVTGVEHVVTVEEVKENNLEGAVEPGETVVIPVEEPKVEPEVPKKKTWSRRKKVK